MEEKNWVRPYWHVDAKWIFGILCIIAFSFVQLFYILTQLFSEQTIKKITTYITASQFSRNGLDNPKDIEVFKQKNLNSNQDSFFPIPGLESIITRTELENLSPRNLRLRIFEQVIEPIYQQKRTEDSMKKLGFLSFLNYETHDFFKRIYVISYFPALVFGIGLVMFSYRYGKLLSPAFVLLFVSTLPSILLFVLQKATLPAGDNGLLSAIPKDVIREIGATLSPLYYQMTLAGLGLIAIAVVIKMVEVVSAANKTKHQPKT